MKHTVVNEGFDIIGDVHGHADKLIGLLHTLGYTEKNGAYRHPKRRVIFVGDLIDNGRQNLAVMKIVKAMHDTGAAQVVMGNHELNAVGYATPCPKSGDFLRRHTPTNTTHHIEFLEELPDAAARKPWIDWFKRLPLFLDLAQLRVIHACWHEPSLAILKPYLKSDNSLQDHAWELAFDETHELYRATETLLKGLEIDLPAGVSFRDHKNKERWQVRISWWEKAPESLAAIAHIPNPSQNHRALTQLAQMDADPKLLAEFSYQGDKPVFFGHYWLQGTPTLQSPVCACVDYSAGRNGPLVAYRWSGETRLNPEHFCGFKPDP